MKNKCENVREREIQRTRDREHIVGTSMRRHEERESKSKRAREQESKIAREQESERARERERKAGKEKEPVICLLWARGNERQRRNPSLVVCGHDTTENKRVKERE